MYATNEFGVPTCVHAAIYTSSRRTVVKICVDPIWILLHPISPCDVTKTKHSGIFKMDSSNEFAVRKSICYTNCTSDVFMSRSVWCFDIFTS